MKKSSRLALKVALDYADDPAWYDTDYDLHTALSILAREVRRLTIELEECSHE